MYETWIRSLEVHRVSEDEDACNECLLKRSNAMRRKGRRVREEVLRRARNVPPSFGANQTGKLYR